MANEITTSLEFSLTKLASETLEISGLNLNQTGSRFLHQIVSVTTTASAVPLPGGTAGYLLIQNKDVGISAANQMYLLPSTGATTGAAIAQLGKNDFSVIKLGAGLQTPALAMLTTAASAEVFILEL